MGPGNPFLGPDGLDWAREQLRAAGHDESLTAHLARKVHETLRPYVEAEPEKVAAACHVLARLVEGGSLDEREYWSEAKQTEQHWDWIPALPRTIAPGSKVRVKLDAYDDERRVHNGQIGVVVGIRRDVVVNYSNSTGVGYHHEMNKLERQVPVRST